MKKLFIFLLIFVSFISISTVKADMSGPEIREFEVVVTNPNGVDYYDYKGSVAGHLEKDEVVYVMYIYNDEYTLGKKGVSQYASLSSIGSVNSLDGFSIVAEEVDPTVITEGITKLDTPKKARINAENGVDIYKGPAGVYDVVGHIPKGAALTYQYQSGTYNFTHIYVEYGGKKGWIEILDSAVLLEGETQYIFSKDVETECGTIPKNTIMTPTYKTDPWKHLSIFEYNGCEFSYNAFKDDVVLGIYPTLEKVKKETTIYEYADKTSTVLGTLPVGAEIYSIAGSADGWNYETESHYYIKYNDTFGWIFVSYEDLEYAGEAEIEIDDTIKPSVKPEEPTPVEPATPSKFNINSTEFIILCALGGTLLVVTAVVIIILVNKGKANKAEPVVETKEEK